MIFFIGEKNIKLGFCQPERDRPAYPAAAADYQGAFGFQAVFLGKNLLKTPLTPFSNLVSCTSRMGLIKTILKNRTG